MATNLLQTTLDQCVADMAEIESQIDSHLEVLAKEVDQGFAQMRAITQNGLQLASVIGKSGFGRLGFAVGVASVAFAGIAGAYQEAQVAMAHNEALDKLLHQKIKIAKAKNKGLVKLKALAQHNEDKLQSLLEHEFQQQYDEQRLLANPELCKGIVSNIYRITEIYKVACYNLCMVQYLQDEYKAWLNYNQRSGQPRPIPSHVNNNIYAGIFQRYANNYKATIDRRCISKVGGGEILFLSDSSLFSCMVFDESIYKQDAVCDLDLSPSGIAEKLLDNNEAYLEYKSSLSATKFWWVSGALGTLFVVACCTALTVLCWGWMENWIVFFRWVVIILIGIFDLLCVGWFVVSLTEDEKRIKHDILEKAADKQLKLQGYVEIYEPDLEKKSVLWAGTKGFFKGLFS